MSQIQVMRDDEVQDLLQGLDALQNNPDGSVVYKSDAGTLIVVKARADGYYDVRYVAGGCGSCRKKR